MGATATRQADEVLDNTETVVATELLCAAQAVDFRRRAMGRPDARLGRGTAAAYELIRQAVPFRGHDAELAPDIDRARSLLKQQALLAAVSAELDSTGSR